MAQRGRDVLTSAGRLARRAPLLSCLGVVLALTVLAVGCAEDSTGGHPATRASNSLMNDPVNYKPDMSDMGVGNGDIGRYSKKGMKHDADLWLNP